MLSVSCRRLHEHRLLLVLVLVLVLLLLLLRRVCVYCYSSYVLDR
jgi:hypothetical protein